MLAFRCPHCGVRVQVEDRWAGHRVRCGGCDCAVEAPDDLSSRSPATEKRSARHGTATAAPPFRGRGDDATEMLEEANRRRTGSDRTLSQGRSVPRATPSSSRMVLPFLAGCLVVFGLGLLGLAGVGLWWYLAEPSGNASSQDTSPPRDVGGKENEDVGGKANPAGGERGKERDGRWTILFRSDNPALWNTASNGRDYAVRLDQAPAALRYLRLRRMDTREMLIVPLTYGQLARANLPPEAGGYSWNGSAKFDWGGQHLGIAQSPRHKFPAPNGIIIIAYENWDVWVGSGFGHKCFVNDTQYYCWKGQEIGRTVFEIAVTEQPLTDNEKRALLSN